MSNDFQIGNALIEPEPEWEIFGTINIEQTLQEFAKSVTSTNKEKRIIIGEISGTGRDEDGEILLQKSLDWSYFDNMGKIKYEHGKHTPENIIGFPHERKTTDSRTIMKGAILRGHPMADSTWGLIKAIEQHNKDFPDHQKSLGFSIEGSYAAGSIRGGVQKGAKVLNVVVTPNPVLKSTWLKTVNDNHLQFFKSLTAGEGTGSDMTNLGSLTGGRAITKENIDRHLKTVAEAKKRLRKYGYEVTVEKLGRVESVSKDNNGNKVKKSIVLCLN